MDIFSADYSARSSSDKKIHIANTLAARIFIQEVPTSEVGRQGGDYLGHGRVRLSELTEGVCRHQSLVFQTLAQAVGLTTRSLKGYLGGVRHATNALRVNGQWYLYDVSNPDHIDNAAGQKEWRPNIHALQGLPPKDGKLSFRYRLPRSGQQLSYILRGTADTHWMVDHPK